VTSLRAFFQEKQVQQMIARAAKILSIPIKLHHKSNWAIQTEGTCEACRFFQEIPEGKELCAGCRMKAGRLALASNVPVTFVCHAGFTCYAAAALPGEAYFFTFGPYMPEEGVHAIEAEVGRRVGELEGKRTDRTALPFDLADIRRTSDESVAAAAEWLLEGLAQLYSDYVREEGDDATGFPDDMTEKNAAGLPSPEVAGEDPRLRIAAAYLLFGKTRVLHAVLEDQLEETGKSPQTRQSCVIAGISKVLGYLHQCGAGIESCRDRFPEFVAAVHQEDIPRGLLQLCDRFVKSVSPHKTLLKYGAELPEVLEEMERRYGEDLQLQRLAEPMQIHPTTLARRLERVTGMKFGELLKRIRLMQAQRLLRRTSLSATAITRRVGIQDQSNFTKIFKRYTGMTPKEYQMRYKQ